MQTKIKVNLHYNNLPKLFPMAILIITYTKIWNIDEKDYSDRISNYCLFFSKCS